MSEPTKDDEKVPEPKPVIATTPEEPAPPQPLTPLHVPDEENELIEKPKTDASAASGGER